MSLEIQADIANSLRFLESSKATERNKHANKMKCFLEKTTVVKLIDINSDVGKKNAITWDCIQRSVQNYVVNEIKILKVNKSRTSQSTLINNKEKKRQEAISFLKYVIKIADNRDLNRLNAKDLVQHILHMLKHEDKAIVIDYQNILLKHVLTSKIYCCEISSLLWKDLISTTCTLITSCNGERSVSMKTLMHIISAAAAQVDLTSTQLFTFFGMIIQGLSKENNAQFLEFLLNALLTFSKAVAIDYRCQLCQLGEDIIPHLLQVWIKPIPASVKESLVTILNLQMKIHHPHGVCDEKHGAWCFNSSQWKKCLLKLYKTISSEIEQASGRVRGQNMKLESGLTSSMVNLASHVCHQLFWLQSKSLISLESSTIEDSNSLKRRKIDICWTSLVDIFNNSQETSTLLSWLQIATKILSTFPGSLPSEEYVPLICSLYKLQVESKRVEIILAVMTCEKHFASQHCHLPEVNIENAIVKTTWSNIWNSTLRNCCSHALQDVSFQLLEVIVKEKLVNADLEPWKLLTNSVCSSSHDSLNFICTYITAFPLPEHFNLSNNIFQNVPCHYPLRHQLFDWLLPPKNKIEEQGSSIFVTYTKLFSRCRKDVLSYILVILTQRQCSCSLLQPPLQRASCSNFDEKLKRIETNYLVSSFDEMVESSLVDSNTLNKTQSSSAVNDTVSELLEYLVKRLVEISEKIMESEECCGLSSSQKFQSIDGKCGFFANFCSLMSKLMGLMLHLKVFTFEDLKKSSLFLVSQNIFKALSQGMFECSRHPNDLEKNALTQSFGDILKDLFLFDYFSTNMKKHFEEYFNETMKILRSLMPKQMINCMMNIVLEENRQQNKTRVAIDVFDGTFVESDGVEDGFESTDKSATQKSNQDFHLDSLSRNEKLRLCYMKIVSLLCSCAVEEDESSHCLRPLEDKIFDFFRSAKFDILKTFHSKLVSSRVVTKRFL
ncbi:serine-protein kinase ATM-like [Xenia sp. Carnegie-2017]|uniref:serine-protein kinase ATM-like n=1 Tax=Xenia sp. Carnegie-2017 TaxID=2897299 RepID=UPI001F038B40|nr:serine-protein kinase ATM-like [Xenia sp. Carnegie-2017]